MSFSVEKLHSLHAHVRFVDNVAFSFALLNSLCLFCNQRCAFSLRVFHFACRSEQEKKKKWDAKWEAFIDVKQRVGNRCVARININACEAGECVLWKWRQNWCNHFLSTRRFMFHVISGIFSLGFFSILMRPVVLAWYWHFYLVSDFIKMKPKKE